MLSTLYQGVALSSVVTWSELLQFSTFVASLVNICVSIRIKKEANNTARKIQKKAHFKCQCCCQCGFTSVCKDSGKCQFIRHDRRNTNNANEYCAQGVNLEKSRNSNKYNR